MGNCSIRVVVPMCLCMGHVLTFEKDQSMFKGYHRRVIYYVLQVNLLLYKIYKSGNNIWRKCLTLPFDFLLFEL